MPLLVDTAAFGMLEHAEEPSLGHLGVESLEDLEREMRVVRMAHELSHGSNRVKPVPPGTLSPGVDVEVEGLAISRHDFVPSATQRSGLGPMYASVGCFATGPRNTLAARSMRSVNGCEASS